MDTQIFRDLESGLWNEINPDKCPCQGNGWILSDWDTWHRCQRHGVNVPHPEEEAEFNVKAHRLNLYRDAFRQYKVAAERLGLRGTFKDACLAHLKGPGPSAGPSAWVAAAEKVFVELGQARADEEATRQGFSCALEASWADEAENDRREAGL